MLKSQFVLPFGLGSILAIALVGGAIFVGPLLTPNQSFLCPGVVGDPTSFQGVGFVTSKPTRFPNGMQFVIKPNSTAFVQTSHYVPSNSENITAQSIYTNWSEYIRPIQYWYKLGSSQVMLNASQVGVTATPVNVTANGNHTLITTYEVSALANAKEGAYITTWFSTCGPLLVFTVGYTLYTGPGLSGGKYL
ncbi:hypothetical protein AUI06_03725 [archaeon 13_2_20CM_2_52_21]|nr:MAG: hypothetical protein AUI06_03725 [archaeon 13_2_20CM_2_52_21]